MTAPGWTLIVPIAVFNIVIGLWTLRDAARHNHYIKSRIGANDPLFEEHSRHPDFPGLKEVSSARAKGIILLLSGVVLLMLLYLPWAG
ncbi:MULTISPECIES: hypothetical protein [Sphingomonadales]|uniref:Uncharacterized protein n=2 Tax=Edaphosphingomonas TaxID=3423724 RepID=A0A2T4HZ74_9SPHN|nr:MULTISPECIES: hypothetical protein [Sphingomonas]AGH51082.1 hypothetical protein G432_16820 [Sphingomonas sp. MM-1]MDX3886035.1 hypothetical protein [Sphingomonas sp.]OHT19636.1 hypothetical protein BHE75_01623 [Sphingomonas haloaromaticamans]PTD21642.1 hypothetical protein CV103_10270 [Sphingomonas fennica]